MVAKFVSVQIMVQAMDLYAIFLNLPSMSNITTIAKINLVLFLHQQRLKSWANVLSHFFAGQVCLQALNAVTGLLLLRWMSITAYAQFGVAFGFQSMIGTFVDLGFSGCIVALAGNRGTDKTVLGQYILSSQYYRYRTFIVMSLVSLVAFPLLTYKQHWGAKTTIVLLATVLAAVFFQGWGMYSAPLIINRRMKEVYTPQIATGVGRLVVCLVLYKIGALSATTTMLVSTTAIAVTGVIYRKNARDLFDSSMLLASTTKREVVSYLAPIFPVIIFTAFQGQVMIVLITIFGHTRSIAEIAALGRLSQLFLVFNAFINMVLMPYFARLKPSRLLKCYLQVVLIMGLLMFAIAETGFHYPSPFLWLLGTKYAYLKSEVGWIIAISCINLMGTICSEINSMRKWRFWWYGVSEIVLVIVVEILGVVYLNVANIKGVILLSGLTSLSVLLVHIVVNIYGLTKNAIAGRTRFANA